MTNEKEIIRNFKVIQILSKLNNEDLEGFMKEADTEYLRNKAKVILENQKLREVSK